MFGRKHKFEWMLATIIAASLLAMAFIIASDGVHWLRRCVVGRYTEQVFGACMLSFMFCAMLLTAKAGWRLRNAATRANLHGHDSWAKICRIWMCGVGLASSLAGMIFLAIAEKWLRTGGL